MNLKIFFKNRCSSITWI